MIVRILGEGQWDVADDSLDELNRLDGVVEEAVEAGNEAAFRDALTALLEEVRGHATAHPDDTLDQSDLILPHSDATLEEVREMLADDGLVPG